MSTLECLDVKVRLSAYLDGEITADERLEVDRHLLDCAACRDLVERAESLDASIHRITTPIEGPIEGEFDDAALAPRFADEVLRRTHRGRGARRRLFLRSYAQSLGLLTVAASLAVAAAAIFVAYTNINRPGSGAPADIPNLVKGEGFVQPKGEGTCEEPAPAPVFRRSPTLARDEAQALLCASQVLRAIVDTPFEDYLVRERLRRTALYDELLTRLADVEPKLDADDRRSVGAAKAIFVEIQREGCQFNSWSALREDLKLLDLPGALDSLVSRSDSANSV